jgi:hypothetical protein
MALHILIASTVKRIKYEGHKSLQLISKLLFSIFNSFFHFVKKIHHLHLEESTQGDEMGRATIAHGEEKRLQSLGNKPREKDANTKT